MPGWARPDAFFAIGRNGCRARDTVGTSSWRWSKPAGQAGDASAQPRNAAPVCGDGYTYVHMPNTTQ